MEKRQDERNIVKHVQWTNKRASEKSRVRIFVEFQDLSSDKASNTAEKLLFLQKMRPHCADAHWFKCNVKMVVDKSAETKLM